MGKIEHRLMTDPLAQLGIMLASIVKTNYIIRSLKGDSRTHFFHIKLNTKYQHVYNQRFAPLLSEKRRQER